MPEATIEEDFDKLEFVKLKIPRIIPIELIEAVKGRTFTPEQFYLYQEQQVGNPYNFLYALTDTRKKIKGYLWAEQNILDKSLFINTFSVGKEFWGKGRAIPKVIEFLKELKNKVDATKVFWITTNERFFRKHNFKASKNIIMEYNE